MTPTNLRRKARETMTITDSKPNSPRPLRCATCGLRSTPGHVCPTSADDRRADLASTARDLAPQLVIATHDLDIDRIETLIDGCDLDELIALAVTLAAAADPWRTVGDGLRWLEPDVPDWTEAEVAVHHDALEALVDARTAATTVDDHRVGLVCAGRWLDGYGNRVTLNRLEQIEAVTYMTGHGVPDDIIRERLGLRAQDLRTMRIEIDLAA